MIKQTQSPQANWEDMLFRGRNKQYGAYVLRQQYEGVTLRAWALASAVLVSLCMVPLVQAWLAGPPHVPPIYIDPGRQVIIENIRVKQPEQPEENAVARHAAPQGPTVEHTPTIVVPDEQAKPESTMPEQSAFVNNDPSTTTQTGTGGLATTPGTDGGIGTAAVAEEADPAPDVPHFVERLPGPVNLDALRKAMGYPAQAIEGDIQGNVIVRVLVDQTGRYIKHQVIKSPHSLLTKAVEAKIALLSFTPAMQGGRAVKCWVVVPFRFRLQN